MIKLVPVSLIEGDFTLIFPSQVSIASLQKVKPNPVPESYSSEYFIEKNLSNILF